MLYKKNGKYYMLRNREYIKVDIKLENNELSIKPDRNEVIEDNGNNQFVSILIDDVTKELKHSSLTSSSNSENRNKYDR